MFEFEEFIHDYSVSIWVKIYSLDTAGARRRPVYPYNWLLGLWHQAKQLETELTPCQLQKVMVHVQIYRKYINIQYIFFLFDLHDRQTCLP